MHFAFCMFFLALVNLRIVPCLSLLDYLLLLSPSTFSAKVRYLHWSSLVTISVINHFSDVTPTCNAFDSTWATGADVPANDELPRHRHSLHRSASFCWTIRIQSFCCDMLWHFSLSSRFQPCTSRWVRSCATTVSPSHGHLKIVRISYHLEMFLSYMWVGWLGRVFMWCEKICRTASWLMPIGLKSTSQSLSPFVIPPSSPWSPLRGDGRGGGFVGFPAPPIPPFWFGWVWLVSKGVPPLTLSISRV